MRRLAAIVISIVGLVLLAPTSASAEVVNCANPSALGTVTCQTTGPAMIDGTSFVGDGGSAAQIQWVGVRWASGPGTLRLDYTYNNTFNTLFSKIGMRLTVRQPTCPEPFESSRRWAAPAQDGIPQHIDVPVSCAGPFTYTITSRAATYSLGGSFIGQLDQIGISFTR